MLALMLQDEKIVKDYVVERLGNKITNYFRIRGAYASELVLFDDRLLADVLTAFTVAQKRMDMMREEVGYRQAGAVKMTVWLWHVSLPDWVERIGR
jgi:hypothetical protein